MRVNITCGLGFAIKIKTDEGILDWVFNNTPVFFIRDPAKFPHFIHTQKRDPQTHLKDADMFWVSIANSAQEDTSDLCITGLLVSKPRVHSPSYDSVFRSRNS